MFNVESLDSKVSRHIVSELQKLDGKWGLEFKGNHSAAIFCPFHGQDTLHLAVKPSLNINIAKPGKPPGIFNCWSCQASGNFNDLAERLALRALKKSQMYQETVSTLYTDTDIAMLFDNMNGLKLMPNQDINIGKFTKKQWRGINGKLIRKIGCKYCYNLRMDQFFLHIPVRVMGEIVGGINAVIEKTEYTKVAYYNTPGEWSLQSGLFPYDYVVNNMDTSNLLIVEGPRDALNCIQHGVPALAILGARLYSKNKLMLIQDIDPDRLLDALDADEAGREAAEEIWIPKLKRIANRMGTLTFPRKVKDPGQMTDQHFRVLKKKLGITGERCYG